jgi:hypothetical protein
LFFARRPIGRVGGDVGTIGALNLEKIVNRLCMCLVWWQIVYARKATTDSNLDGERVIQVDTFNLCMYNSGVNILHRK